MLPPALHWNHTHCSCSALQFAHTPHLLDHLSFRRLRSSPSDEHVLEIKLQHIIHYESSLSKSVLHSFVSCFFTLSVLETEMRMRKCWRNKAGVIIYCYSKQIWILFANIFWATAVHSSNEIQFWHSWQKAKGWVWIEWRVTDTTINQGTTGSITWSVV